MVTWLPAWAALAAALVPLALAAGCALPATMRFAHRLLPVAALPAGAAALLVPTGEARLEWLVAGVFVAFDDTGRAFLALSSIIWTAAACYAAAQPTERPERFAGWFCVAMAGNLALCTVTDPAGFYSFFAMMALSTYALVTHAGPSARSAGRAYMLFTIAGEALLICGLFITGAAAAGVALGETVVLSGAVLVLLAFGVKIGALGLHGWMPVSYPAAPPAAAAALAGSMSTAGVLGLLRFLPGGESAAAVSGPYVMAFGLAAAFYGAVVGLTQTEPRTLLAYSSISQFGLVTVAIGAGLAAPDAWPLAAVAAAVYAIHHGLAKAALFLGEDLAARACGRAPFVIGLALPALALAGAPLTSGATAKLVLKDATALTPGGWGAALESILPLAAVGTTLLMARFLYLAATRRDVARLHARSGNRPAAVLSWVLLLATVAAAFWLLPYQEARHAATASFGAHNLWLALWPLIVGAALAAFGLTARGVSSRLAGIVPPADVYAPILARASVVAEDRDERVRHVRPKGAPAVTAGFFSTRAAMLLERAGLAETGLMLWTTAATAVAALTAILALLASRT